MRSPMKWSRVLTVLLVSLAPQLTLSADRTIKDFTLASATDNSVIHLADYNGKVVLLNWWRTSCAWSQKESPKLVELYKQYHDKGLVILGISDDTADTVAQVPAYLKRQTRVRRHHEFDRQGQGGVRQGKGGGQRSRRDDEDQARDWEAE